MLIDLCHPLYLLAMIVGLPERGRAMFGHVTGHEAEDNAAVLLCYPNGAIGIAETSSVTRITPFTIEIHGTEGSILYSEPGIGALVAAREGDTVAERRTRRRPRLRYRSIETATAGWQEIEVAAGCARGARPVGRPCEDRVHAESEQPTSRSRCPRSCEAAYESATLERGRRRPAV